MKKFLALISIAILLSSCGDLYIPMSYGVTSNDSIGTTIIEYSQSIKYKVVNIKPYEELTPLDKSVQSPYYKSSQSTKFCDSFSLSYILLNRLHDRNEPFPCSQNRTFFLDSPSTCCHLS